MIDNYFKVCADEIRTHKKVCPKFGHTSKFSFLGVFMSNNGGNLTIQYNLRWSEELKNKIAESAKAHNRSMNADIVARLEKSFEEGNDNKDSFNQLMNEFVQLFLELKNNQSEMIELKRKVDALEKKTPD